MYKFLIILIFLIFSLKYLEKVICWNYYFYFKIKLKIELKYKKIINGELYNPYLQKDQNWLF